MQFLELKHELDNGQLGTGKSHQPSQTVHDLEADSVGKFVSYIEVDYKQKTKCRVGKTSRVQAASEILLHSYYLVLWDVIVTA